MLTTNPPNDMSQFCWIYRYCIQSNESRGIASSYVISWMELMRTIFSVLHNIVRYLNMLDE
jgi:hypothetical protein